MLSEAQRVLRGDFSSLPDWPGFYWGSFHSNMDARYIQKHINTLRCVHRSWTHKHTHTHTNRHPSQYCTVLSRLAFLTSSSSSVQLNIPFQLWWQDAGLDIALWGMFIAVSASDCTSVLVWKCWHNLLTLWIAALGSVALIFWPQFSNGGV